MHSPWAAGTTEVVFFFKKWIREVSTSQYLIGYLILMRASLPTIRVAKLLGITADTLHRWIRERRIEAPLFRRLAERRLDSGQRNLSKKLGSTKPNITGKSPAGKTKPNAGRASALTLAASLTSNDTGWACASIPRHIRRRIATRGRAHRKSFSLAWASEFANQRKALRALGTLEIRTT